MEILQSYVSYKEVLPVYICIPIARRKLMAK